MLITALVTSAFAGTYTLDTDHSSLVFVVPTEIFDAKGRFTKLSGTIHLPADGDLNDLEGEITVEIESLSTDLTSRDNLLRASDYFDTTAFATARFVISDSLVTDEDRIYVTGEMTIKDRTHTLELPLEVRGDPAERLRFTGSTTLSRKRFGLLANYPPNPIGDEVELTVDLNLLREPEPVAPAAPAATEEADHSSSEDASSPAK